MAAAWFVVLPHYLWRYERGRGLLKCAALLGAVVIAYLLSLVVHYALA